MSLLKHTLRRAAARALKRTLPYTAYPIDDAEYLGHVAEDRHTVAANLRSRGYHYQLLAAVKQHDGATDVGSYTRIPDRHPDAADGTALDALDPRACQYHVHLFETDGGTDVYGHYEIHPYPWTPTIDVSRPYPQHYRPTWDAPDTPREEWTYLRGVSDPRLDPLLQ